MDLPQEIWKIIFELDPTYRLVYATCMEDIRTQWIVRVYDPHSGRRSTLPGSLSEQQAERAAARIRGLSPFTSVWLVRRFISWAFASFLGLRDAIAPVMSRHMWRYRKAFGIFVCRGKRPHRHVYSVSGNPHHLGQLMLEMPLELTSHYATTSMRETYIKNYRIGGAPISYLPDAEYTSDPERVGQDWRAA